MKTMVCRSAVASLLLFSVACKPLEREAAPPSEPAPKEVLLSLDVKVSDEIQSRNPHVDRNFVGTAIIASSGFALHKDGGRWIQLRHCSAGQCPGDPSYFVKIEPVTGDGYRLSYQFRNGSASSSGERVRSGADIEQAMASMRQHTTPDDALGVLIYRDLLDAGFELCRQLNVPDCERPR